MKFLVYAIESVDPNASLDMIHGTDKDISRVIKSLNDMTLYRVVENQTVNLLVDNVEYDKDEDIITADIYKTTNHGKPLHLLTDNGDEMTIQQILSEHEDAFVPGNLGIKRIDGEFQLIIESKFGSYFAYACNGMDITPRYSDDAVQAIQDSETIGDTTIDFAENYDLSASLFQLPPDKDIREEKGMGKTNLLNKMADLIKLSKSHRMSLDIDRDEWLTNVELFNELIESGIVTRIRVEETKDNIVKLGEGGERAIRKSVETNRSDKRAVKEAFDNLPQ